MQWSRRGQSRWYARIPDVRAQSGSVAHTGAHTAGRREPAIQGLSLAGTAMQERFVQQATFNFRAFIVSAGWRRNLSPTLSLQLQGSESFYRFTQLNADTHQTTASLTLAKQFSRATLSAYAEWLHQSSSVPPGVTLPIALYSDGLVGLNVSYDLIGRPATAGQ